MEVVAACLHRTVDKTNGKLCMNKALCRLIVFLSALILIISASSSPASEGNLTEGAVIESPQLAGNDAADEVYYFEQSEQTHIVGVMRGGYPPFVYVYPGGVMDGFDVRVISWVAHEEEFRVKYQPVDWVNIIPSLKAKDIDMIASAMTITDERKKEVNFTVPYWKISDVLVVRKNSNLKISTALANNNKIGVGKGTATATWMENNLVRKGKKIELVYYNSEIDAIEDVINGTITAVAMDDTGVGYIVKTKPVKIIGRYGFPDAALGYAVRKEDTALLAKLDAGLKRLMSSLYWRVIKLKYFSRSPKMKKKGHREIYTFNITRENFRAAAVY